MIHNVRTILRWPLVILLVASPTYAENTKSREWLDLQWKKLEDPDLGNRSYEEQLASLRHILGGIGPLHTRSSEELELYRRTQIILTSIPGHAHYFRDRILEAKAKGFKDGQPKKEPEYGEYRDERFKAFQVLAHLPSLETMEVLFQFLDDHDRPAGYEADPGYFSPLSSAVRWPILQLVNEEDVPGGQNIISWQQWGEEIRKRTRTFRFKGSPVRYTLAGPVEAAPPLERERKDGRGGSERGPGSAGEPTNGDGPGAAGPRGLGWPLIVAVAVLVGAVVVCLLRRTGPRRP